MPTTDIEDGVLNSAKLNAIEPLADVTDAANVGAAGAGLLGTAQEWTRSQNFNQAVVSDGVNISWNLAIEQGGTVTLQGDRTLDNPTNQRAGMVSILFVIQDSTGTRLLTFGTAYKWKDGTAPTLSTGANAIDILTFVSDGVDMHGTINPNSS